MQSRALDPQHLDVAAFAADAGKLDGDFGVAGLPRLASSECPPDAGVSDAAGRPIPWSSDETVPTRRVRWHAVGSLRPVSGLPPEIWLALRADATVVMQCQRCLLPVAVAVDVDRRFRFVEGEDAAAALDEEIEDEVLALPRSLDLRTLVEDEMLLALPLVPRHDTCPEPLPRSFGEDELDEEAAEHPFAKLAILRKDTEGDGGPNVG
jgi:uncharacterized protein